MQNTLTENTKRLATASHANNNDAEKIAVHISCDGKRHTVHIVKEATQLPRTVEQYMERKGNPFPVQMTEICALQVAECDGHTCRQDRDGRHWW
jgi:hypothetical protein